MPPPVYTFIMRTTFASYVVYFCNLELYGCFLKLKGFGLQCPDSDELKSLKSLDKLTQA